AVYYPEMTTNKPDIFLMVPPAFSVENFELFRLDFGDSLISDYGQYDVTCIVENSIAGQLPVTNTASFQYMRDDWFILSETRNYVEGDMTVGDLNNDNFPDVILSSNEKHISVMLNNGKGAYKNPTIYQVGYRIKPVTTADVNNDGYLDMLVSLMLDSNEDYSEIAVFLNKGNGAFGQYIGYGAGKGSQQVTAADVNNDGFIDMIVSNNKSKDLSVLINKGDGTFNREERYDYNNYVVVDMNNDGFVDLLSVKITNKESQIFLLFNRGDGTFKSGFLLFTFSNIYSVKPVDLNNDNFVDLIVQYNDYGIKETVYINKGDNTFERRSEFETEYYVLSDLNNDGLVDILAEDWDTSKGGYILYTKFNKGDGTFDDSWFVLDNSAFRISTSDMNNDGYTDIIASTKYYSTLGSRDVNFAIFLNNGDKSFKSPVYYGSGGEAFIDDVDNDGFKDIIAYSHGISVLLNTGHYN
ncbi:VCBS repeat-containing protein, partial [bacterium]|nr:VCBS repeat-containing protein [bacterium]